MNMNMLDCLIKPRNYSEEFLTACLNYNINLIKYLTDEYKDHIQIDYCKNSTNAINHVFSNCYEDLAKYLIDNFSNQFTCDIFNADTFCKVGVNGNTSFLQFIFDKCNIKQSSKLSDYVTSAFIGSFVNSKSDNYNYLIDNFKDNIKLEYHDNFLIKYICKTKNNQLLKFLIDNFKEQLIYIDYNYALFTTCENGDVDMFELFVTLKNYHGAENIWKNVPFKDLLKKACNLGYSKIFNIILQHYSGLNDMKELLEISCEKNHISIFQTCLRYKNDLENELKIKFLKRACVLGHFEIFNIILKICSEFVDKLLVNELMEIACSKCYIEIVQMITLNYKDFVDSKKLYSKIEKELWRGWNQGRFVMLDYLFTNYKIVIDPYAISIKNLGGYEDDYYEHRSLYETVYSQNFLINYFGPHIFMTIDNYLVIDLKNLGFYYGNENMFIKNYEFKNSTFDTEFRRIYNGSILIIGKERPTEKIYGKFLEMKNKGCCIKSANSKV